jgi:hypothetical protein
MACNIWITIGECDNKILTITAFALNQRFNSNQIRSVFGNRQFENNSDYRLKKYGHGFWVQNTQRLERELPCPSGEEFIVIFLYYCIKYPISNDPLSRAYLPSITPKKSRYIYLYPEAIYR